MNSDEREERLREVRGRLAAHLAEAAKYKNHEWASGPELHYYEASDDVDFLLSRLDSQAETMELLRRIPAVANDVLNQTLGQIQESAAARMRDLCVERVRKFRDASYWSDVNHAALSMLINEIDNLTLDQVEEKQ